MDKFFPDARSDREDKIALKLRRARSFSSRPSHDFNAGWSARRHDIIERYEKFAHPSGKMTVSPAVRATQFIRRGVRLFPRRLDWLSRAFSSSASRFFFCHSRCEPYRRKREREREEKWCRAFFWVKSRMQLSRYGKYCRYRLGAQFIGWRDLYKGARGGEWLLSSSLFTSQETGYCFWSMACRSFDTICQQRPGMQRLKALLSLSFLSCVFFSYFYRQDDADDDETLRPVDLEEGGV